MNILRYMVFFVLGMLLGSRASNEFGTVMCRGRFDLRLFNQLPADIEPAASRCVSQLVMTLGAPRCGKPRPPDHLFGVLLNRRFGRLLPPPTLSERCHRSFARRGIAVRWRSILMMPKAERPLAGAACAFKMRPTGSASL